MNGIFSNLINTWREIWRVLGVAQRVSIILILIVTLAIVGGIVYWGSQPDWMVVYADIEPKTAAKIYEMARDENIPVRLKDGSRTVLVPSRHVSDLRMRAEQAELGIHQQGSGWELFDNVKLGLTEKQQEVGYQRAMQGELERMIMEMPGIDRARVMLAMAPKRAMLRAEQQNASASVMLTLKPGYAVDATTVKSIRFLVSSAVPDLPPGEVTITDSHGRLLAGRDSIAGGTSTQLETQALLEDQLRRKAEAILAPIAGDGNVVATVSLVLDTDQIDRVQESYDGDNAVVVSEKVVSEESEKQDRRQATPAGTGGNLVSVNDPAGTGATAGDTSVQERRTIENQYLVPKTTEKTHRQGVRIQSMSVAVTIGRSAEAEPRSPEQLEALRKLVASAVGAVDDTMSGRVDTVEIIEQVFVVTEAEVLMPVISLDTRMQPYLSLLGSMRPVGALAMLVVFYLFFRRLFNRSRSDDIFVGSEQLGAGTILQLGEKETRARETLPDSKDDNGPLDIIRNRTQTSPDEVSDAVESMLRAELD